MARSPELDPRELANNIQSRISLLFQKKIKNVRISNLYVLFWASSVVSFCSCVSYPCVVPVSSALIASLFTCTSVVTPVYFLSFFLFIVWCYVYLLQWIIFFCSLY